MGEVACWEAHWEFLCSLLWTLCHSLAQNAHALTNFFQLWQGQATDYIDDGLFKKNCWQNVFSFFKERRPTWWQAKLRRSVPAKTSNIKPLGGKCLSPSVDWCSFKGSMLGCDEKLNSDCMFDSSGVSWSVTFSDSQFSWDLHSWVPWPVFKQRMHWWYPNLQRPLLTGLLHFFSRLKCQHNGLPCWFLVFVPFNDGGNWGAFLTLIFFLSGFSTCSESECCLSVSKDLFVPFGQGTRWTLMRGSCMSLRKASARGGTSAGLRLISPLDLP